MDKVTKCILDVAFLYTFCSSSGLTMETDNTGSFEALEAALRTLERQRNELEELWESRKLKLDLCLQLRLFERDALEVKWLILPLKLFSPLNIDL